MDLKFYAIFQNYFDYEILHNNLERIQFFRNMEL